MSRLALEDVAAPGPWRARGACTIVPTEVFFPGRGVSLEAAKAVCRACPVLEACRDYAVPLPELKGVWGGLGEEERRRLRAGRGGATPAPAAPPPKPPQTRRRPARPGNGALYRELDALTASPGRWAQVVRYPDANTAAAMAARLRGGWVAAPEGGWEFEARPDGTGSALFARYRSGAEIAS
jgi:WhiB family redox-sensing transcriptional regulator